MGLFKAINEILTSSREAGGMRIKYAKLLDHILSGHENAKIFVETRTYIRAGAISYGGSLLFHIQQNVGNSVLIDYEVSKNPVIPDFTLRFSFPDNMDQDEMWDRIGMEVKAKMDQMLKY